MGLPILFRGLPPPPTITGAGASTFAASVAASGLERFSAVGASAFGFAADAAASETFSGGASSSFTWSDAATATERFVATATGGFGFASAAAAVHIVPLPPAPERRAAVFVPPRRPRRARISGAAASAFGMRVEARGRLLDRPVIVGQGRSAFAFAAAGSATLDLEPLRIALEDEAWLLGIDDQELAAVP